MIALLGLDAGDWDRGREHAVIPGPDRAGFWSREAAEGLAARAAELREAIPPQPLGAHRCAELLAELTGLDVTGDDVLALAGQGHVNTVGYYKDWPLYDVAAVRRLGTTEDGRRSSRPSSATGRRGWRLGHDQGRRPLAGMGPPRLRARRRRAGHQAGPVRPVAAHRHRPPGRR